MHACIRHLVAAGILLMPQLAFAEPITLGTWSLVGTPNNDGVPFWDGISDDEGEPGCPATSCNAGAVLVSLDYGDLEYLHADADPSQPVAFAFDDDVTAWTAIFTKTILNDGTPGQNAAGAITYDTNPGQLDNLSFNSLDQPGQFALFRQVGPESVRYFIAFEDAPFSIADRDYNDLIMGVTPVPEPATMLLLATGLAGLAARRLRRRAPGPE